MGGYYSDFNLETLQDLARTDSSDYIKIEYWNPNPEGGLRDGFGALFPEAKEAFDAGKGRPAKKGDKIGPTWSHHWFKVDITVPKEYQKDVICEYSPCDRAEISRMELYG